MTTIRTNAAGDRRVGPSAAIRILESRSEYLERKMLARRLVGEPCSYFEQELLAIDFALRCIREVAAKGGA
jgi:hypothetical protein